MYAGFDGYFSARTAGCIVSTLNKSNDKIVAYNVLDEKKSPSFFKWTQI
jgi:hypothetical protein